MAKSLIEMAADIATAQASHTVMSPEEMEEFLNRTFRALQRMKSVEGGEATAVAAEPEKPAEEKLLDPKKSIQANKVICLECGKEFKQLSRVHLDSHGLTARDYRKKYGFSAKQALTTKSLSAQRRKRAKEIGLGGRVKKGRGKKR